MSAATSLRLPVCARLSVVVACLLPHWAWAQSAIPFKHENAAGGSDVSRVILALLLCVLVLALALFLLRKYLPGIARPQTSGRRLQVLETQRLGPRTALHVVLFGEREYLIGDSEHGLVNLTTGGLPSERETAAGAAASNRMETTVETKAESNTESKTEIETKRELPDAQP